MLPAASEERVADGDGWSGEDLCALRMEGAVCTWSCS